MVSVGMPARTAVGQVRARVHVAAHHERPGRREVDASEAGAPAARHRPGEALGRWLHRYADFLATRKGLAAALHSGDPAFDALPDYFRAAFEPALARLLDAAAAAGEARKDVDPYDLLRAIGNLSAAAGEGGPAHASRMIDLLIQGLRGESAASPHAADRG